MKQLASRPARCGFSLLEMMCVMLLLTVLIASTGWILSVALEAEGLQRGRFDSMLQQQALVDRFREDVADAVDAADAYQDVKSGPTILILTMKGDERIIYSWREGKLERSAIAAGQKTVQDLPVGDENIKVEFVREENERSLVRMRFVSTRDGEVLAGVTQEFAAALGGTWR
jgi:prepilin-type N-terminal cleavage/methylation domain-containing protein